MKTFGQAFQDFVNDVMKDANKKGKPGSSLDDIVNYATDKAYNDMQLRTLPGHTSTVKASSIVVVRQYLRDLFTGNPQINSQKDFDNRHEQACNKFLAAFNTEYGKKGGTSQVHGKAQKIVNMSLKYIYCLFYRDQHNDNKFDSNQISQNVVNTFNSAPIATNVFDYCHMPLDSYTLNWYYREVNKTAEKLAWSSLKPDEYEIIQDEIRGYLQTQVDLPTNVLQAEYIIWQQEKARAMVNELIKILANNDFDNNDLKPFTKAKKKNKIKANVKKIIPII